MNKYFITTTLPYNNGLPHLGSILEMVQADMIVRYLKSQNNDVIFNTGLDEEGLKIYQTALKLGKSTQTYLDEMSEIWIDTYKKYDINYDIFYRTSNFIEHKKGVEDFWLLCQNKGYIYKKTYSGKYCLGCESYKTTNEIINDKCPDHLNIELHNMEEENYFFKVSLFKNSLLEDLINKTDYIKPNSKLNELKILINNAEDLSISRLSKNVPLGIKVPGDPEHTIYVWFSALLNYIISAGWNQPNKNFEENWNNVIQTFGIDNLKFQGVMFQAMLKAASIKPTSKLLVHTTVLDEKGNKMSKSMGNVVDPVEQLEKFGLYAVRYYIIAGLNTYENSSWVEDDLIKLHNSHLANDFGNLVSRVAHLKEIFGISELDVNDLDIHNNEFKQKIFTLIAPVHEAYKDFELKQAMVSLNHVFSFCNKYITDKQPWKNKEEAPQVLNNINWVFKNFTNLYEPVLPGITDKVKDILDNNKKDILFPKIVR